MLKMNKKYKIQSVFKRFSITTHIMQLFSLYQAQLLTLQTRYFLQISTLNSMFLVRM